jgi:coproporphyrinogen III oxidase-like Fe-S oxidoreductase
MLDLFSKYNFSYQIATRYETLNEENLWKLAKINISKIQIWLQSISKLANIGTKRNINLNEFIRVIESLKSKWIFISIDLILWLPWDYLKDFLKTFNFAVSLKPSNITINSLFINPKTELYKNRERYWIITNSDFWKKWLFHVGNIISSNSFSEKDILLARKYVTSFMEKVKDINIILR